MPRRLLALAFAALAVVAAAGCADDVSPAARVGDVTVGNDALLEEVDQWAGSPTLLSALQIPTTEGDAPGSYSADFVDFVLTNRVGFEIHNAKFDDLGLKLSKQDISDVRTGLFNDPAATEAVFKELSGRFGEQLVADVARQFAVQQTLGDGYDAWLKKAYAEVDIEINPRYGSWDGATGRVQAPSGPATATTSSAALPASPSE